MQSILYKTKINTSKIYKEKKKGVDKSSLEKYVILIGLRIVMWSG